MGKLFTLKNLKETDMLRWYISSEHDLKYGVSREFPYECAIPLKTMHPYRDDETQLGLQVRIRQFIEQSLTDTVIVDQLSLSYYYKPESSIKRYSDWGYNINHGYCRFFFESEASQVMFALHFSSEVKPKMRWEDGSIMGPSNMPWSSTGYPVEMDKDEGEVDDGTEDDDDFLSDAY